ncbi:MAG TPA: glycosyltransferase family 39 protein [Thermoanaerobaculia bacterium]|jgi:hypothetical protein
MRHDRLALALVALAALRIAATLTTFSATPDEPVHVGAGVQLLTQHRYEVVIANPPVPRLVFAAPLVLSGVMLAPGENIWTRIPRLFYANGRYRTNLLLARAGNLLFFLVAALATWRWARREGGPLLGLVTTLFFTTQPIVLGYSGLATHDTAATAGVALALLAFSRWAERPDARRAALFGAAYGLAMALKLSCAVFVPAACLAWFLVRRPVRAPRLLALAFAVAFCAAAFTLWASYGFTTRALFEGVASLREIEGEPFQSYFFGERGTSGWLLYFPAAVMLKSTLASLLFVVIGAFVAERRVFLPALAASLAILACAMPSSLDLGVRYVLPLYAPLSLCAAAGCLALRKPFAIALVAWHLVAGAIAHPDYFPYFNELALPSPGRYLVDSNLDWGQDVLRLGKLLRREHVPRVGLALVGNHDYDVLGFPSWYEVAPTGPPHGAVAIGEHIYRMTAPDGAWWWLRGRPYRRVGTSIRLYVLP